MTKFLVWEENYYALHQNDSEYINKNIFDAKNEKSAYKKYCEKESQLGNNPSDAFVLSFDNLEKIKSKKLSYKKEDIEFCKMASMFSCTIIRYFNIIQIENRVTDEGNYCG